MQNLNKNKNNIIAINKKTDQTDERIKPVRRTWAKAFKQIGKNIREVLRKVQKMLYTA